MTLTDAAEAGLNQGNIGEPGEKRLPRRDWIMLPLISLLTMAALSGVVALMAGRMFSQSATGVEKCLLPADPVFGVHGRPNAVCSEKGSETALIEYRLNSCGYRMDVDCGPPQPGNFRIVTMGSSVVMGWGVPRERSLAALLPTELARRTQRKIEVYNEGMSFEFAQVQAVRFSEVLAAKPNLVLWILVPADIEYVTDDPPSIHPQAALAIRGWRLLESAAATGVIAETARSGWQKVQNKFLHSRTGVLLQHYLYRSQAQYIASYLRRPDGSVGFLRAEPGVEWSSKQKVFDQDAAIIAERAKLAGIPFAVVLLPNRAEAAMISMGHWPAGFDPYKLGEELRPIIERHGGTYIDILPDFRAISNPEKNYFPVDGHPNADGHALFARLLAKDLTSGALPALNADVHVPSAPGLGR